MGEEAKRQIMTVVIERGKKTWNYCHKKEECKITEIVKNFMHDNAAKITSWTSPVDKPKKEGEICEPVITTNSNYLWDCSQAAKGDLPKD
jgi:hypothetical protein